VDAGGDGVCGPSHPPAETAVSTTTITVRKPGIFLTAILPIAIIGVHTRNDAQ
jgi:hypothetical protein